MNARLRSQAVAAWVSGMVAGTVDIGSACVIYKASPFVILQAIAGGVLGKASFDQGWRAALLGLVLQWGMSVLIAGCCLWASVRMALLGRRWVLAGLIYGTITFFMMNYVVVPLSAVGRMPAFSAEWFVENMLAMWLFGLIISGIFTRMRRNEGRPSPQSASIS